MAHPLRTFVLACAVVASSSVVAACGASGSTAESASTTRPAATTTEPNTTEPNTTEPSTTAGGGAEPAAVDCQALLQEYTDRFTMDDLTDAAAFFRQYAPSMPDDVAAASLRIADAYDQAKGDPANLNFGDLDLTADAQTFSDWTNDGCPPE